ncbi:MAG: tRNA pseudouridine(55) synthase TruB [Bacteroidales bacterium]|nr:tRNA pseudouridine(55) synthase TruB [Bacteroidales bacterium]
MTQEELLEGVVIPVDKPLQWTSFQVVNKVKTVVRNVFGIKKFKIGHAGTLDPLASGLLLICVGKATKRIEELQAGEKVYSGTMVLGATTPCYDLERAIDHFYPYAHITPELVEKASRQFVGRIEQVPPIFSAVKIGGQRAYRYAREAAEGQEAPMPTSKEVYVSEFTITAFRQGTVVSDAAEMERMGVGEEEPKGVGNWQLYKNPQGRVPEYLPQVDFRIRCGKGTYVRSIARDLGLALDSGAFLASLRREQVGPYTIADAVSVEGVADYLKH